jgi:hypothetical protein
MGSNPIVASTIDHLDKVFTNLVKVVSFYLFLKEDTSRTTNEVEFNKSLRFINYVYSIYFKYG